MRKLPNYNPAEHTPRLEDAFMTRREALQRTGMGMGALSLAMLMGGTMMACVMVAAFAGVFEFGILIERFLGKRVIRQTGLVCWSCGYNLGSPGITICPRSRKPAISIGRTPASSTACRPAISRLRMASRFRSANRCSS